jgi:hypothetical protein
MPFVFFDPTRNLTPTCMDCHQPIEVSKDSTYFYKGPSFTLPDLKTIKTNYPNFVMLSRTLVDIKLVDAATLFQIFQIFCTTLEPGKKGKIMISNIKLFTIQPHFYDFVFITNKAQKIDFAFRHTICLLGALIAYLNAKHVSLDSGVSVPEDMLFFFFTKLQTKEIPNFLELHKFVSPRRYSEDVICPYCAHPIDISFITTDGFGNTETAQDIFSNHHDLSHIFREEIFNRPEFLTLCKPVRHKKPILNFRKPHIAIDDKSLGILYFESVQIDQVGIKDLQKKQQPLHLHDVLIALSSSGQATWMHTYCMLHPPKQIPRQIYCKTVRLFYGILIQ